MAQFALKYIVTAIGANSVTLTPWIGTNSSGPVSGTLPTGYQDLVGGHSTLVLNFSGTPDSKVFPRVGAEVYIEAQTAGA
jgi:hypothetical protein